MKLVLGFQIHTVIKQVVERELKDLDIKYKYHNSSHIELLEEIPSTLYQKLKNSLGEYGIHLKETPRDQFIQKVKDSVIEIVYGDTYQTVNTSNLIAEKLNLSYGYIANTFSAHTLNTLENYIILQKIERAKAMILSDEYTLTEIAYKLNYSSVGHLSSQFKKITGLTSTTFLRIVKQKNSLLTSYDD
ncbi:AraC family transcriptional regulator [Algoriphagus sp. AGSA1]|uniref:helix-turn-helix domain-containing protein n=1 Tax=Algoriphagus sp. AGSA1 TaxID=2907213 RepID=UPI001F2038FF|nr:helix-turn-helix domain-containing protein [Algoriphagus sp. AGSA1]MCE7054664.1 AraC family transcriptional regulator [Algoriphagus sp. AGSA1]